MIPTLKYLAVCTYVDNADQSPPAPVVANYGQHLLNSPFSPTFTIDALLVVIHLIPV